MADFLFFTEGANDLLNNGLTGEVELALSTKDCNTHLAADTFAGGFGEITGTGYARKAQASPAPSGGKVTFAQAEWKTEAAKDWPAGTKSCVLVQASKLICAWNLQAGGGARDLSGSSTVEKFTGSISLA